MLALLALVVWCVWTVVGLVGLFFASFQREVKVEAINWEIEVWLWARAGSRRVYTAIDRAQCEFDHVPTTLDCMNDVVGTCRRVPPINQKTRESWIKAFIDGIYEVPCHNKQMELVINYHQRCTLKQIPLNCRLL